MGWNISIALGKPISIGGMQKIVADLPPEISAGRGKQVWGWSLAVDVRLRNPMEIGLSGSYGVPQDKIEPATKAFVASLDAHGYEPVAGKLWHSLTSTFHKNK